MKDGDIDFLLFALRVELIVTIPADEKRRLEESRISMGELVQEIKAQIAFVDSVGADKLMNHLARWSSLPWTISIPEPNGKLGQEESCFPRELMQDLEPQFALVDCQEGRELMADAPMTDFFFRYERHYRLFQRVQLERRLGLSYDIGTRLSREYDQSLDRAIEQLFNLAERRMLRYLRECGVCQRWYWAKKSDQDSCSTACRERKYRAKPETKKKRQDNYVNFYKTREAKKPTRRRKTKYA